MSSNPYLSFAVLNFITNEGPQRFSTLRERFGSCSYRKCTNFLIKVGLVRATEEEDPLVSLSSEKYKDPEEVKHRIVEYRINQKQKERDQPLPPPMPLDSITRGMAAHAQLEKAIYRLKPSVRKRVLEQLPVTGDQLDDAERTCDGSLCMIVTGNVISACGYALTFIDNNSELQRLVLSKDSFVGHGNEESEE